MRRRLAATTIMLALGLQQEMSTLIEERKTLVQDAAKRSAIEVKDPNPRPAGAAPAPAR